MSRYHISHYQNPYPACGSPQYTMDLMRCVTEHNHNDQPTTDHRATLIKWCPLFDPNLLIWRGSYALRMNQTLYVAGVQSLEPSSNSFQQHNKQVLHDICPLNAKRQLSTVRRLARRCRLQAATKCKRCFWRLQRTRIVQVSGRRIFI